MKSHLLRLSAAHASNAIRYQLHLLQKQYDLTDVEMLIVLLEHQRELTKYLLRDDCHPGQPDRKADET